MGLLDTLQVVGSLAARLPYGVCEPILFGTAATSLYTAGLTTSAEVDLWVAEPLAWTAGLIAQDFLPDDAIRPPIYALRHSGLQCTVRLTASRSVLAPVLAANTVRVSLDDCAAVEFDVASSSLHVIGIEDVIADQIVAWLGQGGRHGEAAMLSQLLVELGRMGVGGTFRPAYLQRRLDHETNGEAVFELPRATSPLDDLSPRYTSVTAIARVVRAWRSRRGLSNDADETVVADTPQAAPIHVDRYRNDPEERVGQPTAPTARIFPFPAPDQSKPAER